MWELTYGLRTDVGSFRTNNQDYANFSANDYGQYLAVVCDGMGGHESGDVASHLAVNSLVAKFKKINLKNWTDQKINKWLRDTIHKIQEEMIYYSKFHPECLDMGTTLVGAVIANKKVYVVNVGDSRLYKLHNDHIYQITVDQNIYNTASMDERMELSLYKSFRTRGSTESFWKVLTSALGPNKKIKVDTYVIEDIEGTYIMTTDGIHDYVDEFDLSDSLLSNNKHEDKIRFLISRALDNLSTDNLTGLIFQIKLV